MDCHYLRVYLFCNFKCIVLQIIYEGRNGFRRSFPVCVSFSKFVLASFPFCPTEHINNPKKVNSVNIINKGDKIRYNSISKNDQPVPF